MLVAALRKAQVEPTDEQQAEQPKYVTAALDTLRKAIEVGYKNFAQIQKDPDLAPLRDLPEFQGLIQPR